MEWSAEGSERVIIPLGSMPTNRRPGIQLLLPPCMAIIIDKILAWVGLVYNSTLRKGQLGAGVSVGKGVFVGGAGLRVGVTVGVEVG